jgi:glycerophosphoryl diester phosphodiesterase
LLLGAASVVRRRIGSRHNLMAAAHVPPFTSPTIASPAQHSPIRMKLRLVPLLTAVLVSIPALHAVEIVAHRGASHDAPENTMAATNLAWQQGADAVETDIYLGKDGKLIVFHDKTAKRTGGRDIPIAELTQEEARTLDAGSWKGAQFKGEKVPLLEEQIKSIPRGKRLLVEIKVGPEIVPELKRVFAQTGATEKNVTVISFNYDTLKEVRKQLPKLKTLWLVSHPAPDAKKNPTAKAPPTVDEMIRDAKAADLTGLDLQHTWPLTTADLKKIKDAGLELHVWTVNETETAKRWKNFGVVSITTDRPGWLREQLK